MSIWELFKPQPVSPALVEALGTKNKFVMLSVGRLTRRKGHDNVLRALPEILDHAPHVIYVIVSTGEEVESLKAMAKALGVDHAVRFVGEVPYQELPSYYNCADLFIMANRSLPSGDIEGFGIVFLEASACAVPVIAGDSGGTRDPVQDGHNGFRIDGTQPRNISAAVLRMIESSELRTTLGRNGRALVEREYAWDRVFEQVLDLSERVVHGAAVNVEGTCERWRK